MTNPFNLIPREYFDYDRYYDLYRQLLELMPSRRLDKKLVYVKTSTRNLWFLLTSLKLAFKEEKFDTSVGVRPWDIGLVMLDTTPLTETEMVTALGFMKALLLDNGVDLAFDTGGSRFHEQIIRTCMGDLWILGEKQHGNYDSIKYMPHWDDIEAEDLEDKKY